MENLELFKSILEVQSVTYNQNLMIDKIRLELSKLKNVTFFEHNENIYVTKKTNKTKFVPCVVSHMDTVHEITSDLSCLQFGDNITGFNRLSMKQVGIGGDDKVGIFICLQSLEYLDNCKVVFFSNEEVGCVGSYMAKMNFFNDCSFVLQCDRKGNSDFVDNASGVELSSIDFRDTIYGTLLDYGYIFSDGGMTDVMALKENGLKVCCANISCGYYNPHQKNEYINTTDVENCRNMVLDLCKSFGNIQFLHTAKKKEYKSMFKEFNYGKLFDKKSEKKILSVVNKNDCEQCENCGKAVEYYADINDYYCNECIMYGKEISEYCVPY